MFICTRPLKSVGNGLCAVPLRGNYNPCGKNKTTPDMPFQDRSESRNLPKLQILPYVGASCYVVDSSTPFIAQGLNDITGAFFVLSEIVPPFHVRNGT